MSNVFSPIRPLPLGNVIAFPKPRRAVLKPVTNDDGHVTGFDLGWITISREMAIRIGRMAEVGAQ